MKLLLLLLISYSSYSQYAASGGQTFTKLSDMRGQSARHNSWVFLLGRDSASDGKGGFYRWDTTASSLEDTSYMNNVPSTTGAKGAWVRIFQRTRSYPQGVLVVNGGVKTLFISGITNSSGEVVINLTDDNTANGNAIFKEIWSIFPQPMTDATGPSSAVQSYKKTSTGMKQYAYGFYKANALTITLGLLFTPVTSIGAGTIVNFRVEGI